MRQRLIAWQTNIDNPKSACDLSLTLPAKKLSRSRNSRITRAVRIQSWLVVIVTAVIVIYCVFTLCLRRLRYTKENDPYYKSLRFGNVSAVIELYRDLAYTMTPRNDFANLPVVFYNLYIPSAPQSQQDVTFDIVKEQLNQVQAIAAQFTPKEQLVVQLITIASNRTSVEKVKDICNGLVGLKCHHLKHTETADEMFALDGLYQYCKAHPSATVTYLHSKGSFHQSSVNDAWRRALTAAALHPDCWGNDICDVCGLQFFTQFTLFWPGNMWTASCQYVSKLIPPKTFRMRQEEAVSEMLLLRLDGVLKSQLLRDRNDYFGLDRYSAEHWIGSHPDLQPCDMDPSEHPQDIFKRNAVVSKVADAFQFGLAPRHVGFAVGHNFEAHERLHKVEEERKKEIYLLPGRIFMWQKLYRRAPPSKSWAWIWFPDGSFWESRIDTLGHSSIDQGALATIFHSLVNSTEIAQIFWKPGLGVIFYFFKISDAFGVNQAMDQMEKLQQETGREWTVVVTVFNCPDVAAFASFCGSLWTECHVRDTISIPVSIWDTAIRMARFCQHQRESSVVLRLDEYTCHTNAHHRLHAGILHDDAIDVSCSKPECSLDFAAKCSFVRQLIKPSSFLRGVEAATKMVLLANVRNERRRQSHTKETRAVEQFLLYAWIAIHPVALPCDICKELLSSVTVSDRDRDIILASLLVVEVFYENRGVVPACAQHWMSYLHIPSPVSNYLNLSTVDNFSHRIYQSMKLGDSDDLQF